MNLSDYLYKSLVAEKNFSIIVKSPQDHYIMLINKSKNNKLVFLRDSSLKFLIKNFGFKINYNCSEDDKRFCIRAIWSN